MCRNLRFDVAPELLHQIYGGESAKKLSLSSVIPGSYGLYPTNSDTLFLFGVPLKLADALSDQLCLHSVKLARGN